MNQSDLNKFFFVKIIFDNCEKSAAIYDASAVNYLWGPESNSWGCYKKKFTDPKIVSKKQGMCFGSGYGLLQVSYCNISKTVSEVPGPAKYLEEHARKVFKEYLREFIKEKVYLIRKTGLLRISGIEPNFLRVGGYDPKSKNVKGKIHCLASIGLCFIPVPFKDLLKMGTFIDSGWYPDWVIDSKRARPYKSSSEHWFDKT